MVCFVEMRLFPPQNQGDGFGCQWATFELMRDLAERNGWSPIGTAPPPRHESPWAEQGAFDPSYKVEDYPFVKLVTAEDARNWAAALEKAARSLGSGILPLTGPGTNVLSDRYNLEVITHLRFGVRGGFIKRFATFLRRGGFTFLWEDGAGQLPRNEDQGVPDDWFDFAMGAWLTGNLEEAAKAFRTVTEMIPKAAAAWQNLGLVLRRQGLRDEAVEAHRQATLVEPEAWRSWQYLGNSLLEAERFGEAITSLRKAAALAPDQASCWSGLGNALSRSANYREADQAHRRAMELEPEDPTWACNHADNLYASGNPHEAIRLIQPWADRFPQHCTLSENLATYLMDAKRYKEAIPYLQRASALAPRDPLHLRRQVICLMELEDKPAAKQALLAHLAIEPDFMPGWGLLLSLDPTDEEKAMAEEKLNNREIT